MNLATEKAFVAYDPSLARVSAIKQAIKKAGYEPLAIDAGKQVDEHKAAKEREIRVLWAKFALSAFFSLPLLYIAMGAMLGWPLPAAINAMQFPLRYALLEIALVVPVIAAGYRFYVVGFRAILHGSPNMDSSSPWAHRPRSSIASTPWSASMGETSVRWRACTSRQPVSP